MASKERWDGGWIHIQKDGKPLFVIARMVAGKRFSISTRAHTATAAYEHLRRFEADPWKYEEEMKRGRIADEGVFLTKDLVLEFRDWLLTRPEKPTSRKYANETAHRLNDWVEDLSGRDLRKLDVGFLKKKLIERETSRQHRIIAIKVLFAWLREEKHVLQKKDDATADLAVPQASPEKHRRRKAVDEMRVKKAVQHLEGAYRDVVVLAAATGWHVSELQRFTREPDSEIVYVDRDGVLAVLQTRHKSGDITRTPVTDRAVLEVAERLRERRQFPRMWNRALKRACVKAKVEPFTLGVMRHTVGTWAVERGAIPAAVSEFLGHRDPRTTKRFYIDVAIPTNVISLPRMPKVAKR